MPTISKRPIILAAGAKSRTTKWQRKFLYQDWSISMAAKCELCGKGPQFGNNVSHANNKTRRRWDVNLRPVKAVVGGTSKRLRVCTSCIKTGKIVKG